MRVCDLGFVAAVLLATGCGGSTTASGANAEGSGGSASGASGSESTATSGAATSTSSGGGAGGAGGTTTGQGGGGAPPACAAPSAPAAFELGTGETCFARVNDGDTLPVMAGPQGGYHMWLALGCTDCGAAADLRWGARDPITKEALTGTWTNEAMQALSGAGWPQHAGVIDLLPGVKWDPDNEPPLPEGTHVLLWAEVVATDGTVLHSREIEVVVGPTQDWNPCIDDPDNPVCTLGG